ncbi:putative bifunctional diguanylate cyclase/phosphodiesterase [Caldimonas tepidiphila]|uniref:putative bifunctional diguanylate cyclase/phosphodiesterase n=1 Tax=Caldimonas tepidiphila TaxID=2315841 RepID=UPI000E5B27EF|nr:EAL domain-containing protein [Caldimonas tepidiphila]
MSGAFAGENRSAEELREALIDLGRARDHERQMRLQTETLLEGLRVLTQAQNKRQVFAALTAVLQRFAPFEEAFLMQECPGGGLEVTESTHPAFDGTRWQPAAMLQRVLSGKTVAVFDVAAVPEWQAQPLAGDQRPRSALHVPLHAGARCSVLVFTHSRRAFFDKHHVATLERFAPLTRQAMASIEYRERLEEHTARIEFLATHDALTGLPNRVLLAEKVQHMAAQSRRAGELLALLFLDLDRFKHINDSFGHGLGDELLKVVAARLLRTVRETDTVTRLGGDEFVVLLGGLKRPADVDRVADKILRCVEQPVTVDGHTLFVNASVGVALFPRDGEDLASLLKNADTAMYRAKDEGGNLSRHYACSMSEHARTQLALAGALRLALERGEFELHYQPRLALASGEIVGMEALLRWRSPSQGLVPPARFIPAAEENGLIVPIGEWVIAEACRQARSWQDAGLPPVPVAVNVSGRQMRDAARLLAHVRHCLASRGLSGRRLEIEFTESVMMQDPGQMRDTLAALRGMGVRLAIDDFGTGYSSLAYLKRFPVSILKIDRSFVRDLAEDADDAAIARAIISMGQALGLSVVAEGVETPGQAAMLRAMGCDEAQGYLFGRPVPAPEMAALLRGRHAVLLG